MVEANHWDAKRFTRDDGFPGELVRVARFDDIRFLPFQDFFDCIQVKKSPVTGCSGNERGPDQERFASRGLNLFRPFPWTMSRC